MFLLGFASCFAYFLTSGLISMWLAVTERDEDLSGPAFFVVTVLWPIGLPWMAARRVVGR
jgi:hypothetical protein